MNRVWMKCGRNVDKSWLIVDNFERDVDKCLLGV